MGIVLTIDAMSGEMQKSAAPALLAEHGRRACSPRWERECGKSAADGFGFPQDLGSRSSAMPKTRELSQVLAGFSRHQEKLSRWGRRKR